MKVINWQDINEDNILKTSNKYIINILSSNKIHPIAKENNLWIYIKSDKLLKLL